MKYAIAAAALAVSGVTAVSWDSSSSTSSTTKSTTTTSKSSTTGWGSPSSSTTTTLNCPATTTSVKTATTTVFAKTVEIYKETVTVDIPDVPQTVPIKPVWNDWTSSTTGVVTVTLPPTGCKPASTTVTSTTTSTATKDGTTTVYKSTLYVGAKGGAAAGPTGTSGSGSGSGSGWSSGTGSGTGSSSGTGSGTGSSSGTGSGSGSESGTGSGSGSGNGWSSGSGTGSGSGSTGPLRPGAPGKIVGTDGDVYKWTAPPATGTKSWAAPIYTKGPDGNWGGDATDNGSSKNGTSGGNGGSGSKNSTSSVPAPGSPASNVTAPFLPLGDSQTNATFGNSAGSRSSWVGGKDITSDYYQDYFSGRECTADLTITNGTSNQDGTDVLTFLINGQSPGPLIECNWGDIVKVTVHNQLQINGTAIHWHGIRQYGTNDQDGVPGVTECAIAPGSSRTYTFHASSYGTSWYHSHWGTQYGDGIRGPLVIHGPATANYDVDAGPVMISDTFGVTAAQQNSLISHTGPLPTVNYLLNGHNTVPDLSSGQHSLWVVKPGKKYLFRFINSAAQNMYSISVDGHKMQVIAADFVPIVPYTTEWLNIGIGQRYDVVIEFNQAVDSYFLRAVTQTLCPSACANTGLGNANGIIAYEGVPSSPYLLPTSTANGGRTIDTFATCDDEPLASLVPALVKAAGTKSAFDASASTIPAGSVAGLATADDGVVFQWFINNGAININYTQPTLKSLAQGFSSNSSIISNPITLTQKNQWVYFVIQNSFFAFHPMHLHGHDHSVLGQGDGVWDPSLENTLNFDNPTRRDTTMLRGSAAPTIPGGYTVIGFETDNPGAWLMHCHIIWHVDGGLSLQWVERPADINPTQYTSTAAFQDECSAYQTYEAQGTSFQKFSGESGLKARDDLFFDRQVASFNRNFNDVVRRDGSARRYLDTHSVKRGLGDGYRRHGAFGKRR